MTQQIFNEKANILQGLVDNINVKSNKLLGGDYKLFGDISLPLVDATVNEAAFIRLTSFYYVLFYEVGKVSVDFLVKEYVSTAIDVNFFERDFRKVVHSLRTMFHHNLDLTKSEDSSKISLCQTWFQQRISLPYPKVNADWQQPLIEFLSEGEKFLNDLDKALIHIDSLETKDLVVETWKTRAFNTFSLYDFEKLCNFSVVYFGLSTLNTNEFCGKRIQIWNKELRQLGFGYDFEDEATKLIERDLIVFIRETSKKLPITGRDILVALGETKADKRIGQTLADCQDYYLSNPCSKEELLKYGLKLYESL